MNKVLTSIEKTVYSKHLKHNERGANMINLNLFEPVELTVMEWLNNRSTGFIDRTVKWNQGARKITSDYQRFIEKINITDNFDECWEWQGAPSRFGYGTISFKGKIYFAHRVSYEEWNKSIPEGLLICHKCNNPLCVNPTHIYAGTHQDNRNDCVRANRQAFLKGINHGRAILTESDVLEIRKLYSTGNYTHQELADMKSVKLGQIGRIIRKEGWRHI